MIKNSKVGCRVVSQEINEMQETEGRVKTKLKPSTSMVVTVLLFYFVLMKPKNERINPILIHRKRNKILFSTFVEIT